MSALTEQLSENPPHLNSKALEIREEQKTESKETEAQKENKYLDKVIIKIKGKDTKLNDLPEIRNQILNPEIMNLSNAEMHIKQVINLVTSEVESKLEKREQKTGKPVAPKWVYCTKNCVKKLVQQIIQEVNSTAFMLRVLSNSVIDTTKGECPLKFYYINKKGEKLSQIWNDVKDKETGKITPGDHRFFRLARLDDKVRRSRLIMGLGPSASGKTFWAENTIKLLKKTDDYFPRSFLSVDGGLIRELSFVYQDIIKELREHPRIDGITNLVSSGFDPFHTSLFSAGHVKKDIQKYLKSQTEIHTNMINNLRKIRREVPVPKTSPVSIYVPETLGSPNPFKDNFSVINKYIKITNDTNWIALYIWQGRTPKEDKEWVKKFKGKYKMFEKENIDALSTTLSGKGRELTEGKKYSDTAYSFSKKHGYKELGKAPGGRLVIHNSGGKYIPHPGEIKNIKTDEDGDLLYSILFDNESEAREKRKTSDIYTEGLSKAQRKEYLRNLSVGTRVKARKEFNKSVVIEFPVNNKYILEQQHLADFHALYVRKEGKPRTIKGGAKKTRRRLRRNSNKRRTRRNSKR